MSADTLTQKPPVENQLDGISTVLRAYNVSSEGLISATARTNGQGGWQQEVQFSSEPLLRLALRLGYRRSDIEIVGREGYEVDPATYSDVLYPSFSLGAVKFCACVCRSERPGFDVLLNELPTQR